MYLLHIWESLSGIKLYYNIAQLKYTDEQAKTFIIGQ